MEYKYQLGFIGAGNMAKAIVQGVLTSNILKPSDIIMSATKKGEFKDVEITNNNLDVAMNSKYLILAVKPQIFDEISKDLQVVNSELIISIMAGKSSNKISNMLNTNIDIIRVMPNTPCLVKKGMCVIAENKASEEKNQFVTRILSSIGNVEYLDEKLFDAMTSISGSGPAYVYYFIRAMYKAGIEEGLKADKALKLTLETFAGAIEMVKNSNDSLDLLIDKVCSKGGTTIQAIDTFNDKNVEESIKLGIRKCKERSEELSK